MHTQRRVQYIGTITFAIIASIVALVFLWQRASWFVAEETSSPAQNELVKTPAIKPAQQTPVNMPSQNPSPSTSLPKSILLSVPFTSQAPTGNWTGIYKEACEEASVIMAAEYLGGNESQTLSSKFALEEIKRLADWETKTFGYNLDINNDETVRMIKEVYGLKAEIADDFTVDDIKQALATGKVVLLAADGRLLGNPNFRAPGPPYHMLVITGYENNSIITNDPGTRKGRSYPYSFSTLYNAAGEWNHATDSVDTSIKQLIIVSK
jgi:hypothetical protein